MPVAYALIARMSGGVKFEGGSMVCFILSSTRRGLSGMELDFYLDPVLNWLNYVFGLGGCYVRHCSSILGVF